MTVYDKRSRLEKSIKILEDGKIKQISEDIFIIFSKEETYTSNLKDLTCRNKDQKDCKDLAFNCDIALNQKCKHLIASELMQDQKSKIEVKKIV